MEFLEKYWIYGLGFFAQSLFGGRLIVQLYHSEKEGKVASPTIFWQLSLVASFLFLIYGILRDDVVIILGQTLSFFIYVRNLQLKNDWQKIPAGLRIFLLCLPVLAFGWMFLGGDHNFRSIFAQTDLTSPLIIMGAVGQLMLNLRFVYQWYYSEKHKTSILPVGFWIISLGASVLILTYASSRLDPVLLVSQGMGIFVYVRNIVIHRKTLYKDSVSLKK
jgi:lipid-A-disaccharide synthase-like uncharacterized protein